MKKLKWASNLLKRLNIQDSCDLNKLKNHGFKKITKRNSTCGCIYIHYKRGLVIKNSYETSRPARTGTKNFVKTLFTEPFDNHEHAIIIQPLCKPFKNYRLADKAADKISEATRDNYDSHSGNVMLYRGRPVLVDW
jgi:hypothetical protein